MERFADIPDLAERLHAGERAALSRAITLVESARPADRRLADELLARLRAPAADATHRLGVTGSPGVGKSTFVEAYGVRLLERGHRVAVLAVDPSSSRTRGSILGDKTRMPRLSRDPRAYVRPSAAGETLGGLASATLESIRLCEAAGFDRVIVETVGVGQSEHAVRLLTDTMLLLLLPGAGDELQGIKRGILELADVLAVHKADADALPLARRTLGELARALHLRPAGAAWAPRACLASSVTKDGLDRLAEALDEHHRHQQAADLATLRRRRAASLVRPAFLRRLTRALAADPAFAKTLAALEVEVADGRHGVESAAAELMTRFAPRPPLD